MDALDAKSDRQMEADAKRGCGERNAEGKVDVDSAMQKTKVVRIARYATGAETPRRKLAAEAARASRGRESRSARKKRRHVMLGRTYAARECFT